MSKETSGWLTVFSTCSQPELRDKSDLVVAVIPADQVDKARRMATCWNAFDGISTEAIEDIVALGGIQHNIPVLASVMAQRDELLEVLKLADELIGMEPFEHVSEEAADTHRKIRDAISSKPEKCEQPDHNLPDDQNWKMVPTHPTAEMLMHFVRPVDLVDAYRAMLAAAPNPQQPGQKSHTSADWQMVPIEPTPEMIKHLSLPFNLVRSYRAMLAAAPKKQQPQVFKDHEPIARYVCAPLKNGGKPLMHFVWFGPELQAGDDIKLYAQPSCGAARNTVQSLETIVDMAREAGFNEPDCRSDIWLKKMQKFAELAIKAGCKA